MALILRLILCYLVLSEVTSRQYPLCPRGSLTAKHVGNAFKCGTRANGEKCLYKCQRRLDKSCPNYKRGFGSNNNKVVCTMIEAAKIQHETGTWWICQYEKGMNK